MNGEMAESIVEKSTSALQVVIFDLDGVIVDTAHYHYLAWKRLAAEIGIELTVEDNERLKGVSRIQSLHIILEIGGKTLPANEIESLAAKKNSWFVEYVEKMSPEEIFPGVKTLLNDLRERGLKVALASSSKNAQRVIELLQINSLFDTVVDGTMITHSKPDPEIFLKAAELLGVEPDRCVVFEDAEAGVEAAVRAGMRCVGIGKPEQLGLANIVLQGTGDFTIAMLEQLSRMAPAKLG